MTKRTLWIRKHFISHTNGKHLKNFQRWLGTRNGKIFRGGVLSLILLYALGQSVLWL